MGLKLVLEALEGHGEQVSLHSSLLEEQQLIGVDDFPSFVL